MGDEQALVGGGGVAVGHAGDVVGDGTQIVALGDGAVILGHLVDVRGVVVEQIRQQVLRLLHLGHDRRRRVHILEQKRPQLHHGVPHLGAHGDVPGFRRGTHHIGDQRLDAGGVVGAEHPVGRIRQIGLAQDPRANGVVDVVVHVRDAIGGAHDAPLAGFGLQIARVVQDAVAHLGRQIQARAAVLDAFHHAHRLLVVAIERRGLGRAGGDPLVARKARGQRRLAGVAEGGVPQVVAERDGLSQVLVQPERPRDGAGDLRHFQRMGEARAEVVALGSEEHLGLVGKPPKRFRVQNLVAIALEVGAQRVRRAGGTAPLGAVGESGLLGEHLVLPLLLVFPIHNAHTSSLPRMFPV